MPYARRVRRTKHKDCAPVWVCVLGAFMILAMFSMFVLSQSLHIADLYTSHSQRMPLRALVSGDGVGAGASHAGVFTHEGRVQNRSLLANQAVPALAPLRFFPPIQELHVVDPRCCAALSSDVRVVVSGAGTASTVLRGTAERVQERLRWFRDEAVHASLAASGLLVVIRVIHVTTSSADEKLDDGTDIDYSMTCDGENEQNGGACRIKSSSIYGAVAALQSTLVQLFSDRGAASFRALSIHDWPRFKIRGLMIDVGRRFVPIDVLRHQVLDGMALTRMNLLHLHLNDFCRFALDLPGFPELRPDNVRMAGQYSVKEMKEFVSYARDRGIRVMPEIDVPGHANALLPLKARGLTFCESDRGSLDATSKIFDDPQGKSRVVLRQLFKETAAVFLEDEQYFHVGADEASPVGSCSAENIAQLEGFLTAEVVRGDLKRTPVGWEELFFKQSTELSRVAVSDTQAIIVAWTRPKPEDVTEQGHRVLVANSNRHYLDFDFKKHPIANFWYDPGALQRDLPSVRDCTRPTWEEHRGTFLGTYADGGEARSLDKAKQDCINSKSACAGVTCLREGSNAKCDIRRGAPFLQGSSFETSWVKICPEEEANLASMGHAQMQQAQSKRFQEKHLGGLSAMWTDRYCYVFQCGAAQEWFAKENGLMPMASLMFSRNLDTSFAQSFAGMVWPRAGVTASALWNYQKSVSEKELLESTAWLATLLRKLDILSCPANCDCDELMACDKAYPVLKTGAVDDTELLSSCFPTTDGNKRELGGPLGTLKFSFTTSLRMCIWKGKDCGGISCSVAQTPSEPQCELRSPGTGHTGSSVLIKRAECQWI